MAGEQIRLLVVEDVPQVASHIRALLNAQSQIKMLDVVTAGDQAVGRASELKPDVVIADIRMPPGLTDDGVRAAQEIRRRHPGTGVLLLSQYGEPAYARDLLEQGEEGVGYLLKDRVADVDGFADAVRRIAAGELVLDPEIRLAGRSPD